MAGTRPMTNETTLHDRLTWSHTVAKMAYGWQMTRKDKQLTEREEQMLDELINVCMDMKSQTKEKVK